MFPKTAEKSQNINFKIRKTFKNRLVKFAWK